MPHSHDDVGWDKTIDGYFYKGKVDWWYMDQMGGVQTILTTVMVALGENPARRFTWSEFKFLEMWWNLQYPEKKEQVRKFV